MNRTWSQAVALVKANFQLLGVLAGVFVLLPTLAIYLAFPDLLQLTDPLSQQDLAADPNLAVVGRFFAIIGVLILFEMTGQIAMIALIGGDRPTVGEAITRAIKALPTTIGTLLLLFLIIFAGALLISVVLGLLAALLAVVVGQAAVVVIGAMIYAFTLAAGLYLSARLCMILPVIVLERMRGPRAVLRRSWSLTRAVAWKIVGFFVLLGIAYLVVSMVLFFAVSALGLVSPGVPKDSEVLGFALVSGLIGAAVTMLVGAILVSIHRQLAAGPQPGDYEFDA